MTSPTVRRTFPVPAQLAETARAWTPDSEPAPARFAATVMLVRDAQERPGVEVFMLHRTGTMAFAPNTWVFPGGGADERDADPRLPWAGPGPGEWATTLGCDEDRARELVVAAAREVFEECGVLLAGTGEDDVVDDLTDPQWDAERQRLLAREISFAELLVERGLVLRSDLLRAHAHWVTPLFEPRRYDTAFFAALLPAGQTPDDRTSEAVEALWVDPAEVLARGEAGDAVLLPPTVVMLEGLVAADGAQDFVTNPPEYLAVVPTLEGGPDDAALVVEVPR